MRDCDAKWEAPNVREAELSRGHDVTEAVLHVVDEKRERLMDDYDEGEGHDAVMEQEVNHWLGAEGAHGGVAWGASWRRGPSLHRKPGNRKGGK